MWTCNYSKSINNLLLTSLTSKSSQVFLLSVLQSGQRTANKARKDSAHDQVPFNNFTLSRQTFDTQTHRGFDDVESFEPEVDVIVWAVSEHHETVDAVRGEKKVGRQVGGRERGRKGQREGGEGQKDGGGEEGLQLLCTKVNTLYFRPHNRVIHYIASLPSPRGPGNEAVRYRTAYYFREICPYPLLCRRILT